MRSISISNTQLALALLIVFFKKDLQSLNLTYSTPTIPNISITFIEHWPIFQSPIAPESEEQQNKRKSKAEQRTICSNSKIKTPN